MAEHYGITLAALVSQRIRGATLEEAVSQPNRYRDYVLEGRKFSGLREACAHYGLKLGRVKARLERDWTLEEAFELVEGASSKTIETVVRGVSYGSRSEAARAHGLSPGVVKSRLTKGWTVEQTLELEDPPKNKHGPRKVSIGEREYPTLADAARAYGLDPLLVRCRVNKHGWPMTQALEIEPRPSRVYGKRRPSMV